jgi:hypothetical protein
MPPLRFSLLRGYVHTVHPSPSSGQGTGMGALKAALRSGVQELRAASFLGTPSGRIEEVAFDPVCLLEGSEEAVEPVLLPLLPASASLCSDSSVGRAARRSRPSIGTPFILVEPQRACPLSVPTHLSASGSLTWSQHKQRHRPPCATPRRPLDMCQPSPTWPPCGARQGWPPDDHSTHTSESLGGSRLTDSGVIEGVTPSVSVPCVQEFLVFWNVEYEPRNSYVTEELCIWTRPFQRVSRVHAGLQPCRAAWRSAVCRARSSSSSCPSR